MPANRDKKTGKWNCQFYYTDWTGKKVKKMKRGFETKKEAQDWERHFKLEKDSSLDMTSGDFYRRYEADVKPKVRENTWKSKVWVIEKKILKELIQNEEFHYVEPKHGNEFIDLMWDLGQAINESRYIEIDYLRTKDKAIVHRRLQPVAIMFSEYYFYLTAFIEDEEVRKDFDVINDSFPTIYRIDRIKNMSVLDKRFHIPYSSRFEEGEFRKRIQFMYGGKIQKIRFRYKGPDIDSILDRLPTAHVLDEENCEYIVAAEVFGTGINMWIRSQGDYIEMIEEV